MTPDRNPWTEDRVGEAIHHVRSHLHDFYRVALQMEPGPDRERLLAGLAQLALDYVPGPFDPVPRGQYYRPAPGHPRTYVTLMCDDCGATWVGPARGEDCFYCSTGVDR